MLQIILSGLAVVVLVIIAIYIFIVSGTSVNDDIEECIEKKHKQEKEIEEFKKNQKFY